MSDILAKIIDRKREEVAELKRRVGVERLREEALAASKVPSFYEALSGAELSLIAEVKKASPSKGVIRADFDPVWIAQRYQAGGASALSVLTDRDFFQGSLEFIGMIRRVVNLPVLRKDFIIDESQVYEARVAGASAVLLIAAALDPQRMAELHIAANEVGLDVLVEVHDFDDVARIDAGRCPARIVGINNRNLRTFEVDLAVTESLAAELREKYLLVSESGIFTPEDARRVERAGARAILVGESLMRQPDPGEAARALLVDPQADR